MELKNIPKPCGCHFTEGQNRPWYICAQHFYLERGYGGIPYKEVMTGEHQDTYKSLNYALHNPLTKDINLEVPYHANDNEPIKHFWLYALKLKDDKYYIGMTARRNPYDRIRAHRDMVGARWTMLYPPLQVYEVRDIGLTTKTSAEAMEQELTVAYMKLYGYKNVRGGKVTYTGSIFKLGKYYLRGNWLESLFVAVLLMLCGLYIVLHNN